MSQGELSRPVEPGQQNYNTAMAVLHMIYEKAGQGEQADKVELGRGMMKARKLLEVARDPKIAKEALEVFPTVRKLVAEGAYQQGSDIHISVEQSGNGQGIWRVDGDGPNALVSWALADGINNREIMYAAWDPYIAFGRLGQEQMLQMLDCLLLPYFQMQASEGAGAAFPSLTIGPVFAAEAFSSKRFALLGPVRRLFKARRVS